jgi:hypothetical protein
VAFSGKNRRGFIGMHSGWPVKWASSYYDENML